MIVDNMSSTDVREEESERDEDRIQKCSDQSSPDSMDMMQNQIKDLQEGSEDPDDEDVDEGEDNCPNESQRNSNNSCNDSIEPDSDRGEDQESQSPDEFKALIGFWFGQDIFEGKIDMMIDLLVISINDI